MKRLIIFVFILAMVLESSAKKYKFVILETNYGTMKIKLYEDTPLHSENFIKLVKEKYYDGLLFHRVIKDFMIQGGAADSRNAEKGKMLGLGGSDDRLSAEIIPGHYHVKGALAAARQADQINPRKESSAEQFYIVQGKTYTDQELDMIEKRKINKLKNDQRTAILELYRQEYNQYTQDKNTEKLDSLTKIINNRIEEEYKKESMYVYPPEIREQYKTIGGTPFLDWDYTVFGEIVEGIEVINKIAEQKTGPNDRPEEDVIILKTYFKRK